MEEKELLDKLGKMKKEAEGVGLIVYPLKSLFLSLGRFEYDGTFSDFLNIAKKVDAKIIYLQKYKDPENPDKVIGFSFLFKAEIGLVDAHSFDVGMTLFEEEKKEEKTASLEDMKKELTDIVIQLAKEQNIAFHWELTSPAFCHSVAEKCGREFKPYELEGLLRNLEGLPSVNKVMEENKKRMDEKAKEIAAELVQAKEEYHFAKKNVQKEIIIREFMEEKGMPPNEKTVYSVRGHADLLIAKMEMQAPSMAKKAAEKVATMKNGDRVYLADMAREVGVPSTPLGALLKTNGAVWGIDVVKEKNKLIVVKLQNRLTADI